jgi:hypothetical protein
MLGVAAAALVVPAGVLGVAAGALGSPVTAGGVYIAEVMSDTPGQWSVPPNSRLSWHAAAFGVPSGLKMP